MNKFLPLPVERGGLLNFLREIPGAIRACGIDSPSGGQARPLGESIGTGRADAND
jgi:hypothetical protein